jgi:lipopolysaccharide export system protein LptC
MRLLRPTVALALLVLLLAGTWILLPAPEPEPVAVAAGGARTVDYAIKGLEVTRMTPAGIPAHRLYAPNLRHYVDDGTSAIDEPRLTVFQDAAPPWEIRARDALVSTDGELVLLRGEVLIEREAGADNRPVRLVTRELRVQPRQDYAETDAAVRVDSDPDWLEAVGMQAWLRPPSRLKFLSQVNAYHVPR